MDEADETLLSFEAFRARVGAAQHRTRAALLALRLSPIRLESDRRQLRYRAEWVAPVRRWLRERNGAGAGDEGAGDDGADP